MRKQISVGLVVAMCASLAVPVSAAETKDYLTRLKAGKAED